MSLSPERRARLALVISAHRAARRVLTPSSPSQVEEEIQTLSQVLAAKEKHLAEIKRKLGIGSLQELRENLARGWQEVTAMPAYVRGPRGPLWRAGRRAPPVWGGEWASERPGAPRRLLPAPHRAPAPPGPRGSASPRLRSSRPCWGPEGSREKHSLSSRDVTRQLARCVSPRYRRQPTERVRGGPDKGRGQTGSGAPGRPAPSRLCAPALCMLRAGGRGPPPIPCRFGHAALDVALSRFQ